MWIYVVIRNVGEGFASPGYSMRICALVYGKTKGVLQGRVKTLPYRMVNL